MKKKQNKNQKQERVNCKMENSKKDWNVWGSFTNLLHSRAPVQFLI